MSPKYPTGTRKNMCAKNTNDFTDIKPLPFAIQGDKNRTPSLLGAMYSYFYFTAFIYVVWTGRVVKFKFL